MSEKKEAQEMPSPVVGSITAHADFVQWLYKSHGETYDNIMGKVDGNGVKREHAAYGALVILSLYMIVGQAAQLVCNLIGFAYPAYISVKAIRTKDTSDDTQWLMYWTAFATFSLVDFFAVSIMSWFPIYWLMKMIFLLYLYLPQTHGSFVVYHTIVDPLVTTIDQFTSGGKSA